MGWDGMGWDGMGWDGWMDGWMDGWTDGWMHVCMYSAKWIDIHQANYAHKNNYIQTEIFFSHLNQQKNYKKSSCKTISANIIKKLASTKHNLVAKLLRFSQNLNNYLDSLEESSSEEGPLISQTQYI